MIIEKIDDLTHQPNAIAVCDEVKPLKLFVVLGMARSGTSAITCGLNALGVNLGDNLLAPVADFNEKGFFEDDDILHLNMEMLSVLGCDWNALPLLHSRDFKKLEKFKSRAMALLRSKCDHTGTFGFKDVRTTRLMPFWKQIFEEIGADVHYIIAFRHPTSVSQSAEKRGWLVPEESYYLWVDYVTASIMHTENQKRLVVDYDLLMDSPVEQLERIAESLSLAFDPASPAAQEYTADFLEKGLRHSRYDFQSLLVDPLANKDVITVYHLMTQLARDEPTVDASQMRQIFCDVRERLLGMNHGARCVDGCVSWENEVTANLRRTLLEREKTIGEFKEALESVEQWQKSWLRRAFGRWHARGCESNSGFTGRLRRSIFKRFKKLLPILLSKPDDVGQEIATMRDAARQRVFASRH